MSVPDRSEALFDLSKLSFAHGLEIGRYVRLLIGLFAMLPLASSAFLDHRVLKYATHPLISLQKGSESSSD